MIKSIENKGPGAAKIIIYLEPKGMIRIEATKETKVEAASLGGNADLTVLELPDGFMQDQGTTN